MTKFIPNDVVIGNQRSNIYFHTTVGTIWIVVEYGSDILPSEPHRDLRLIREEDFPAYMKLIIEDEKGLANSCYTYVVCSSYFDLVKRPYTNNKELKDVLIRYEE